MVVELLQDCADASFAGIDEKFRLAINVYPSLPYVREPSWGSARCPSAAIPLIAGTDLPNRMLLPL